ncbi:MAG TPA: hypothetical protein VJ851_04240 [Jatrophihabitans sp.]|nr:hypothetical protein [Jatrophihabitans sp.]
MSRSINRLGSAVLELLLPSARAQACTLSYCEQSGTRRRCCKNCPGGVIACLPWQTGSCKNYNCPN